MKRPKSNSVNIPLDFTIACMVNKIKVPEVLQIFIDHVSLYDAMNKEYSEGFTEAIRVISTYVLSKNKNSKVSMAFRKCEDDAINCLLSIMKLTRAPEGSNNENRMIAQSHIDHLFTSMERVYTPFDSLYIDEYSSIHLSKDFCILCEMHNCYPQEYIEHFMREIPLLSAFRGFDLADENSNPCLELYSKIINGFGKPINSTETYDDSELNFYDLIEGIRFKDFDRDNLEEWTVSLRNIFQEYYPQQRNR